jgi:hypothetical protein
MGEEEKQTMIDALQKKLEPDTKATPPTQAQTPDEGSGYLRQDDDHELNWLLRRRLAAGEMEEHYKANRIPPLTAVGSAPVLPKEIDGVPVTPDGIPQWYGEHSTESWRALLPNDYADPRLWLWRVEDGLIIPMIRRGEDGHLEFWSPSC